MSSDTEKRACFKVYLHSKTLCGILFVSFKVFQLQFKTENKGSSSTYRVVF